MKCYISKNYRHIQSAGDKAKTDIEAVMDRMGYRNLGLPQNRSKNAVRAYLHTLASVLRGVMRLSKGDIVVVQYPLKKYYDFVVKKAVGRGAKVITVIHDLGSFRRRKLTVEEEVARLNMSAVIVVHSAAMRDWLRDHGIRVPMVVLGLFDYLSTAPVPTVDKNRSVGNRPELVFAGNCSPSDNGWIYELAASDPSVDLILYGGGVDQEKATPNIKPQGYVDSDTLIAGAKGDYGVVWYGNSIDEGAGALGEYLRYNAPHKTSLYLRAGLPVIIWDQAALAQIVKRLDVGICVPSLRNIGKVIAEIDSERDERMRANAVAVAARLTDGRFIEEALNSANELIEK